MYDATKRDLNEKIACACVCGCMRLSVGGLSIGISGWEFLSVCLIMYMILPFFFYLPCVCAPSLLSLSMTYEMCAGVVRLCVWVCVGVGVCVYAFVK